MNSLNIFCVTDKPLKYLEDLNIKLVGVGKRKFSQKYITCLKGNNIQKKEKYYSELTFHYWFWKNKLKNYRNNDWIGFCQKRRFWTKNSSKIEKLKDLKKGIITRPKKKWSKYESIICKSIRVDNPKRMKLIKRGWRNILKDPSIININQMILIPRKLGNNIPVREKILLITGYGSGHGVGMSQWGARYMATKGAKAEEILKHFYKGVRIKPFKRYFL